MEIKTTTDTIIFYPKTGFDQFQLGELAGDVGEFEVDIDVDKGGSKTDIKSVEFEKDVFLDYLFKK